MAGGVSMTVDLLLQVDSHNTSLNSYNHGIMIDFIDFVKTFEVKLDSPIDRQGSTTSSSSTPNWSDRNFEVISNNQNLGNLIDSPWKHNHVCEWQQFTCPNLRLTQGPCIMSIENPVGFMHGDMFHTHNLR